MPITPIITPSSVEFSYTKGTDLPPYREMEYDPFSVIEHPSPANGQKYAKTNVDWITVTNFGDTTFQVRTNSNADNLVAGTYTQTVEIFLIEIDSNDNQIDHSLGSFELTLNLSEGAQSVVTPSLFNFNHDLANDLPTAQEIAIVSWRSWTLRTNASWLRLSSESGRGDKTVTLSVVSSLEVGTHHASVIFFDGVLTKNMSVTLQVTHTINDYLTVLPTQLSFQYVRGTTPPIFQSIELTSSHTWTITSNEDWLNIPIRTGNTGTHVVEIGVQNLENLTVGQYSSVVIISNGGLTEHLEVNLSIIEYIQNFPSPDVLHFTDDENLIQVATANSGTCLKITLKTIYQEEDHEPFYRVPFFKGIASENIGAELATIIGTQQLTSISRYLDQPYRELSTVINVDEVHIFEDLPIVNSSIDGVFFLRGIRPDGNFLSEVGSKLYLTKEGVLSFSFLNEARDTVTSIVITGAVEQTITVAQSNNLFYTLRLPLSDFDLRVGDVVNFSVLDNTVQVVIKENEIESTMVFWENKWGCFDSLEFTGEYKETSSLDYQTAEYFDRSTNITKTLEVESEKKYDLNTGWLHSYSEIEAINNMLQSKNIYLVKNNNVIKVVPKTKNLVLKESNEIAVSRKLNFLSAEK